MVDTPANDETEHLFEQALTLAEKHLDMAMDEAGDLADYVAVAMIEAAVNQAIEAAGHEDMIAVLRDLADQIESDMGDEGGNDDEDEGEEEEDNK